MISTTMLRTSAALITLALAGCGGGGGGNDGGGGGGGLNVTMDHASVTSLGFNDSELTSDVVSMSMTGGSGTYYAAATSDNDEFYVDVNVLSDTSATVTVKPRGAIASGTSHTGHLTYKLCRDQGCATVAWSRSVPYTITRFQVATTPIALTGTEGIAATPVSLAVTPPDTAHLLMFTSSNPSAMAADHSDPAKVLLTVATPHASSLSATLDIEFPRSQTLFGTGIHVPVQLTVASDISVPAITPITLDASTSPASLSATAAVSFAKGTDQAWSGASDRAWLVLDAAQGTGAGALQFHVDTSRVDGITNWTDDIATITVTSAGLSPLAVPVTLRKHLPELSAALPGAVVAGQASTLRVTGRGLLQAGVWSHIRVGSITPTGGSILSDTAATLQLPALPAGATRIAIDNTLAIAAPSAPLMAQAPGAYAAAVVPYTGTTHSIAFDAARQAVFATVEGVSQAGTLVRYQLVGATWQVTTLALDRVGLLALSPDHATVWVGSGTNLLAVDPDTLQVRSTTAVAPMVGTLSFNVGEPMPITSDDRLWLTTTVGGTANYYDLRAGTFGTVTPPVFDPWWTTYSPAFAGTPGGTGLYLSSSACCSPIGPSYWYDPATGAFTHADAMPAIYGRAVFDAFGEQMLVDNQLLYRTGDFTLTGNAVIDGGSGQYTGYDAVLSQDGRRAYRLVAAGAYQSPIDHVEAFDTTTLVPGTSTLASLGTIALPDKATTCLTQSGVQCDSSGRLALDPAGTALFWVGEHGLVVVPIPAEMSGVASTSRARAASAGRLAARR